MIKKIIKAILPKKTYLALWTTAYRIKNFEQSKVLRRSVTFNKKKALEYLRKSDKSAELLVGKKVILYGSSRFNEEVINYLKEYNINPAYFVITDPMIFTAVSSIEIHTLDKLLCEDKSNLKIIIMSPFPQYESDEKKLSQMGLGECIYHTKVKSCYFVQQEIVYSNNYLCFCCNTAGDLRSTVPEFPMFKDNEKTMLYFLYNRKKILDELLGDSDYDFAEGCKGCIQIKSYNALFGCVKITNIGINCEPHICQAKCIYCGYGHDLYIDYKAAKKKSHIPKMVFEMIKWSKKNNYFTEDAYFAVAPAEITVLPHKELLYEEIKSNQAYFATNAFIFDNNIAESMKKNNSMLYASLDSGCRETFKTVKGFDLFDRVKDNLMRYRENGLVRLKYIILPGVNDNTNDIEGFIKFIKQMELTEVFVSHDYHMPLRACYYGIKIMIAAININKIKLLFHPESRLEHILEELKQYKNKEVANMHEINNDIYVQAFNKKFKCYEDYKWFRNYVFKKEFSDLIINFAKNTRFGIVQSLGSNWRLVRETLENSGFQVQNFNQMNLLDTNEENIKHNNVDIFLIDDANYYRTYKNNIKLNVLDIETYMQQIGLPSHYVKTHFTDYSI